MNELEKFSKKAETYREALKRYPTARLLELYPIFSILLRVANSRGTSIQRLKIVDLMAGSGFLAENLHRAGFRNLHAVEFCDEMAEGSQAYVSKARLHQLGEFEHLEGLIDELKPDVVVSLAGFHHLIVNDKAGQPSHEKSVMLQAKVIDRCMRALGPDGVMIVCDLFDDNVAESPLGFSNSNMKKVWPMLEKCGLNPEVSKQAGAANSISGASSAIHRSYGISVGNPSLDWFRNVVDEKFSLGHKDVALSRSLQERIAHHSTRFIRYNCPWVFKSTNDARSFLFQKFGFSMDKAKQNRLSESEMMELANKSLGVRDSGQVTAVGWALGMLVIGQWDRGGAASMRQRVVLALCFTIGVLLGALFLRNVAGVYANLNLDDVLVFLVTLPIGYVFGEIIARWRT